MYKRIIYQALKYPLIGLMALKSLPAARKAAITPDKLLLETPYQGQPILLIALYQQGKMRPDIARLLILAKEIGLYVLAVNNAHLDEPIAPYADCYIERCNFGRDFASYQKGFNYIFQQQKMVACPRVLMINDSVYYDTSRSKKFLEQLIDSNIEVLGATENFEITHHIGSFCVSVNHDILQHPRFRDYWAHYQATDVRLLVIYRGEIELSRCLLSCVSSPEQFKALYGLSFLDNALQGRKNIHAFLSLAGRSTLLSWPKLNLPLLWASFANIAPQQLATLPSLNDLDSVQSYFEQVLNIKDPDLGSRMDAFMREAILAQTKVRSQIHLNNAFLVHMGLPIIKLDGFYRGVFSIEDVMLISQQLPATEAAELEPLLTRRPYGKKALHGWDKLLFMWGLI